MMRLVLASSIVSCCIKCQNITQPPSINPTLFPTTFPTSLPRISCGTNTWCYAVDIHPLIGQTTSGITGVISLSDEVAEYHVITFEINGSHCVNPTISLSLKKLILIRLRSILMYWMRTMI